MLVDRLMADFIVVFHGAFILFAMFGGFMVLRWGRLMYLHLPCVAWAIVVEVMSWPCPLTRWENFFRDRYGAGGYDGGFIDNYLIALIYPDGLTHAMQIAIGLFVFLVNFVVYGFIHQRYLRRRRLARSALTAEGIAPNTALQTLT